MDRRGFLGVLASLAPIGVFGLPEVKAAPAPFEPCDEVPILVTNESLAPMNNALIPELWAKDALKILQENMVMGQLVNEDCEKDLKKWSRVNVRKRSSFLDWSRKYK